MTDIEQAIRNVLRQRLPECDEEYYADFAESIVDALPTPTAGWEIRRDMALGLLGPVNGIDEVDMYATWAITGEKPDRVDWRSRALNAEAELAHLRSGKFYDSQVHVSGVERGPDGTWQDVATGGVLPNVPVVDPQPCDCFAPLADLSHLTMPTTRGVSITANTETGEVTTT